MGLFNKLFGTRSEREVKKLTPLLAAANNLQTAIDDQTIYGMGHYRGNGLFADASGGLPHSLRIV